MLPPKPTALPHKIGGVKPAKIPATVNALTWEMLRLPGGPSYPPPARVRLLREELLSTRITRWEPGLELAMALRSKPDIDDLVGVLVDPGRA